MDDVKPTVATILYPNVVVESGDPMLGGREVWQRYPDHPECDTLLCTVHYSYGALDNSSIGPASEAIADLFRTPDQPTLSAPVDEWETFSDVSYFDMWCVRRKSERTFGQGFHLVNGDEARGLVDLLNSLSRPKGEEMVLLSKMPRNWELTCGPVDGDLSDEAWQVHSVNGGSNDREWTLLAQADDPAGALRQAIAALGSSSLYEEDRK